MNNSQKLWWEQARSDQTVFSFIRKEGLNECHSLHYLQMTTEKLAKAYFWRSGSPPPRSHAGFVQFLRILGQIQQSDQARIAKLFSFNRFSDFRKRIRSILPIAYELERLAPDLAGDGPNPEYPWPHSNPECTPAGFQFPVWESLRSGAGRDLMRIIQIAVDHFPEYADT